MGREAESARNIYCEPLPEVRNKLNFSDALLLKVEGRVYGLRTAPRNWWKCSTSTLQKLGWGGHQLGLCVHMLYDTDLLLELLACV